MGQETERLLGPCPHREVGGTRTRKAREASARTYPTTSRENGPGIHHAPVSTDLAIDPLTYSQPASDRRRGPQRRRDLGVGAVGHVPGTSSARRASNRTSTTPRARRRQHRGPAARDGRPQAAVPATRPSSTRGMRSCWPTRTTTPAPTSSGIWRAFAKPGHGCRRRRRQGPQRRERQRGLQRARGVLRQVSPPSVTGRSSWVGAAGAHLHPALTGAASRLWRTP